MEELTLPAMTYNMETTANVKTTINMDTTGSSSSSSSSRGGKQEPALVWPVQQQQHQNHQQQQQQEENGMQLSPTLREQQQLLDVRQQTSTIGQPQQQQHGEVKSLSLEQQQVLASITGVGTRPSTSASPSWASTVYSASTPWLPHLSSAQLAELTKAMADLAPQVMPSREWLRGLGAAVSSQARGFKLYEVYTLLDGLQCLGVELSRQGWLEGLLLGMLGRSDVKDMPRMLNLMKLLARNRCTGGCFGVWCMG